MSRYAAERHAVELPEELRRRAAGLRRKLAFYKRVRPILKTRVKDAKPAQRVDAEADLRLCDAAIETLPEVAGELEGRAVALTLYDQWQNHRRQRSQKAG